MMLLLRLLYLLLVMLICCQYSSAASATRIGNYSSTTQSGMNLPCPNAEDIAPCICGYYEGVGDMDLHCDNIADEQQLYDIFHANIPVPQFRDLYLDTSSVETLREDVFGDATFVAVFTYINSDGILKSVDPAAFIKSASTLRVLDLYYNELSDFPIDSLSQYSALEDFSLYENPISSFPIIESQTLTWLDVRFTQLVTIPEGALDGLPKLKWLSLYGNPLSSFPIIESQTLTELELGETQLVTIPEGALDGLPNLERLGLSDNPISSFPIIESQTLTVLDLSNTQLVTIPEGALDGLPNLETFDMYNTNVDSMPTGLFAQLGHIEYIDMRFMQLGHLESSQFEVNVPYIDINLRFNKIAYVEVDAFKGVHNGYINLKNNQLTILPEETWRPMIDAGVHLTLYGNDLTCGCDVAWLVLEPNYHEFVDDARCQSGSLLVELDPKDFENCNPLENEKVF